MSEVQPFPLQNSPSLFSPHNLTPILKSLRTTSYHFLKGLPAYLESPLTLTSNSMSNLQSPGLHPVTKSSRPLLVPFGSAKGNHTYHLYELYQVPFHACSYTSPSLVQKLQTIQNSALHIVTGCVRMSSIDHLHEETKMPHVQDHLSLISSQYLARAMRDIEPCM